MGGNAVPELPEVSELYRKAAAGQFRCQVELELRCGAISIHQNVRRTIRVELKVLADVVELLEQLCLTVTDACPARRAGIGRPFETEIVREPSQDLGHVATFIVAIELRDRLPGIHGLPPSRVRCDDGTGVSCEDDAGGPGARLYRSTETS